MKKSLEQLLRPTHIVRSVEGITPESLRENNFDDVDAIAFDVDGTLMSHHETRVEPVVYQTLKALSVAGHRLFIISNAYGERVDELYDMFGNNGLAMGIVAPQDVTPANESAARYRKPNPAMLEWVSNKVGGAVLMVGDQMAKDVVSANRAAMPSILLPRRGNGDDPRVKYLQRPLEAAARGHLKLPKREAEYPETLRAV